MTTPPERPPGTQEPDEESWVAQLTATEPAVEREGDWDEVFAAEQAAADAALATEVARQSVTVVLVSHDGARWLPGTLAGLAAQTHRPDRIVAVDTGSTDGSVRLLTEALGEHSVFTADRTTGFGAAVQRALTLAGGHATGWIWILHDDCAPDPDALEQLLRAAVSKPGARVLGPKAVDFDEPRRLVEVGLTTDPVGRRVTGLEDVEYDQGQHDRLREVLAVGSAGMLVDRSAWDELGGFDRRLKMLRDDLDFGWRANRAGHTVLVVPAARVRHARAASTGQRALDITRAPTSAVGRRHGLFVVLANGSRSSALLGVPRLTVVCLARAGVQLLGRRFRRASSEVAAVGWLWAHLPQLALARRRRARTATLPPGEVEHLLLGRAQLSRTLLSRLRDLLRGTSSVERDHAAEIDVSEEPRPTPGARLARLLASPGSWLGSALAVVSLAVQWDRVAWGSGLVYGGRLLPAGGASDLWAGFGHTGAPAYGVLALPATLLAGKAWVVVRLLLLGALPAAGVMAYRAAGALTDSLPRRLWAGAAYALLPVGIGAVCTGRLDTLVTLVLLPPLVAAAVQVVVYGPGVVGWRPAARAGLLLAVAAAFAPLTWVLAAILLAGAAITVARGYSAPRLLRRLGAVLVVLGIPVLLLAPWLPALARTHWLLVDGIGLPQHESRVHGWQLLFLSPGGPGVPALGVAAAVVLFAFIGLWLRVRGAAVVWWLVAVIGLAAAMLVSRLHLPAVPGHAPSVAWPGVPLVLAGLALIAAALATHDSLTAQLQQTSFGWRQPASALLTVLVALAPLALAWEWGSRGDASPLHRREVPSISGLVGHALGGRSVLYLDGDPGEVRWTLAGPDGARLGDEYPPADPGIEQAVRELAVPRGVDPTPTLARYRVRYVVVRPPADPALARALIGHDGLAAQNRDDQTLIWQVVAQPSGPPLTPAGGRPGPAGLLWLVQALAFGAVVAVLLPRPHRRRRQV
ncbi:MAG: glycosyltransferase [Mycobacteriales bacterium]